MFESNFPVDKISGSYAVYWNAFKRLAAGASAADKAALFRDTARSASTASAARNEACCAADQSRRVFFCSRSNHMKIERVRSQIVRLPADEPPWPTASAAGRHARYRRRQGHHQGRHRRARRHVLRRGADGRAQGRRRRARRADRRRRPHRDRAHRRQAARRGRQLRARRHLHAGAVRHRYGVVGHPRQGAGAAGGQAARAAFATAYRPTPAAR